MTLYPICKDNKGIKHKFQADWRLKTLAYIKTTWTQKVDCKGGGAHKPNSIYDSLTYSLFIILKWKDRKKQSSKSTTSLSGSRVRTYFIYRISQPERIEWLLQSLSSSGILGQWNKAGISYVWSARAAKCLNQKLIFNRIKVQTGDY